jgi:GT2 family glycosyltransferase
VSAPDASIIIPVHNRWTYTLHCLAVLQQHKATRSFEVIVVDDGSSDGTASMLADWPGLAVLSNPDNRGFVRACNAGAASARGKYLVLLNNDTQVQPGWLDALLHTFERHQNVGLVGSKLIYPDGRLQEAGGIVFSDGSAWNYGHLDDPGRPEYSYLRESDYVSGASVAIERRLFDKLGGFDDCFAPGYYEDLDLAFRARQAGYRILYQPASVVVHFEGASAGTDEAAATGMKRFQAANRRTFVERWGTAISDFGQRGIDLERQKERHIQRRAFIADIYMLTPDQDSGSLRMLNIFRILQGLGFKITFAASSLEALEPYASDLQGMGVEVIARPYVTSIPRHLAARGPLYDLVVLSRADTASALLDPARRYCPRARIVFDTVDIHYLREQRLATLTGDQFAWRSAERRRRQELDLIARADLTVVVSAVEQQLLQAELPQADVRVVSNIHRIRGSRRPFSERRDILFIGAFAHPPNTDAVLWFCREIFPLVLQKSPDIHLFVIGANPPRAVQALGSTQTDVLGYVPDVSSFFDKCRLSVAPMRYGAGVKGKINQSLACGLPVVATSNATEGMFLEDGVSVLIADSPTDFADQILRAYGDEALWESLCAGGLAVMKEHFSFAAAHQALQQVAAS